MKTRKIYRDGIEEEITGKIKRVYSQDGHAIEIYKLASGEIRYFVTLAGTAFCAHGNSIEQAILDAEWKDESKRPSRDAIVAEIKSVGPTRKITLNEFRLLTGACLTGCLTALENAGIKKETTEMTAHEIAKKVSKEWGNRLLELLEWQTI